jgi:SAM-dependent methyltransferase
MAAFRIETFGDLLLARLAPGSRVLEIGCGAGELASKLSLGGLDVTAIDRTPRAEFPSIARSFEEYDSRGRRFDCIVAMLVLHHVDDLDGTIAKMASLLTRPGFVAIDDYGWERRVETDEETKAWRADRGELHTSVAMLSALDRCFKRTLYKDHPYFDEGQGEDRLAFTYVGTPRVRRPFRSRIATRLRVRHRTRTASWYSESGTLGGM